MRKGREDWEDGKGPKKKVKVVKERDRIRNEPNENKMERILSSGN